MNNITNDISNIFAILDSANEEKVLHKSVKVYGFQEPGFWMCDLYGSVSKFYFGDKTINEDIKTELSDKNRPGTKKVSTKYVCIHDTASISKTANAYAHAKYVQNGGGGTSWSYSVGSDGIYHQIPDDEVTYHAGDKTRFFALEDSKVKAIDNKKPVITIDNNGYYNINGISTKLRPYKIVDDLESIDETVYKTSDFNDFKVYYEIGDNGNYLLGKTWFSKSYNKIANYGGNRNSIGIESCVNETSDLYKTWHLLASLVARLMLNNNLDINRVVQHHFFSGKNCPQTLRMNGLWDNLIEMIKTEYSILKDYSDYKIEFISNNKDLVADDGRVLKGVLKDTLVSYTVTVSKGNVSKSKVYYSTILK